MWSFLRHTDTLLWHLPLGLVSELHFPPAVLPWELLQLPVMPNRVLGARLLQRTIIIDVMCPGARGRASTRTSRHSGDREILSPKKWPKTSTFKPELRFDRGHHLGSATRTFTWAAACSNRSFYISQRTSNCKKNKSNQRKIANEPVKMRNFILLTYYEAKQNWHHTK